MTQMALRVQVAVTFIVYQAIFSGATEPPGTVSR